MIVWARDSGTAQWKWLILPCRVETFAGAALMAAEGWHGSAGFRLCSWLSSGFLGFSLCGTCWGRDTHVGSCIHMLGAWAGVAGAAGVWPDIYLYKSLDDLMGWQPQAVRFLTQWPASTEQKQPDLLKTKLVQNWDRSLLPHFIG